MATQSFNELLVWQNAHQFVLAATTTRRHSHIAEGYKKRGKADKARLMNIAQGSIEECRYYLILSHDLGYGENGHLTKLLEEISKMLESYISKILSFKS